MNTSNIVQQETSEAPAQLWQIGDLISVGNRIERRLIIHIDEQRILVISETGWFNCYQKQSELPLHFLAHTELTYAYKGREPLYRDFKAGLFTSYFTIN